MLTALFLSVLVSLTSHFDTPTVTKVDPVTIIVEGADSAWISPWVSEDMVLQGEPIINGVVYGEGTIQYRVQPYVDYTLTVSYNGPDNPDFNTQLSIVVPWTLDDSLTWILYQRIIWERAYLEQLDEWMDAGHNFYELTELRNTALGMVDDDTIYPSMPMLYLNADCADLVPSNGAVPDARFDH